jgi:ATP-binding cassette subfamily B protein
MVAGVSVVAGLSEAALLTLVATSATALSQGRHETSVSLGGFAFTAPLSTHFAIALSLAVFRGALQVVLAYLPAAMSAQAMADLRRRLFDAFESASWAVKASERDGHFQSLMSVHITNTAQAIITLSSGITAVTMFTTLLVSAFVLSVGAASLLTLSSGLLFALLRPLARRLRKNARSLSAENIEYSKGVQEVVLMAEEVEAFGASKAYKDVFYALVDEVRLPQLRTRFLSAAVPALYQSVALIVLVAALAAVARLGTSQIASLSSVVLLLVRSLTYGQQIQNAVTSVDASIPFINRLADAIARYRGSPHTDGPDPLASIERIGVRDVRFSYVRGTEVLHGITVDVSRGEALGVVGPSGSGKSSLVQVLLRLREPDSGVLYVDGQDARQMRRSDWQRLVAYVPQTPQLIYGTVRENIRFFRPELSDDDIEEAARRARIHEEILSWPKGYDTVVGQRASAVSGGQRQRLCLARALAASPDVLVLDEPTSALDVRSEELVQKTLQQLKGSLVLVLVAHRLSTLTICDRVMVVVDGRLEALDTPSRLKETNAFFREVNEITSGRVPGPV